MAEPQDSLPAENKEPLLNTGGKNIVTEEGSDIPTRESGDSEDGVAGQGSVLGFKITDYVDLETLLFVDVVATLAALVLVICFVAFNVRFDAPYDGQQVLVKGPTLADTEMGL